MTSHKWFGSRRTLTNNRQNRRPRLGLLALERRDVPSTIPALNSLPGAPATLYLDFDGHYEATWGSYSKITTPAFNQDGNAADFSAGEIATITAVWARAAEDYAPFNINVTTVEPAVLAPGVPAANANGKALRVSIGGNSSWMGASWGGYAYINSFTNSTSNVCFVFDTNNNSGVSWLGDAVSHEAGHSFGLQHQSMFDANGVELAEYNSGNAAWAPLMGSAIYATATTVWHNGTTLSATTFQDDLAIIAGTTNKFGYRADDHGNSTSTATVLTANGQSWSGAGVITTNTDVDYFKFTVSAADTYRIAVGGPGSDANLDAIVELRNSSGQLLETANPPSTLDANIVRYLSPGVYTAAIKSTGAYGYIGTYKVAIDAPPAGITVTPASAAPVTYEDGRTTSFTLVLETRPMADVVIPVSSTNLNEGKVSTSNVVFTAANWNIPQTVTVAGVADGVVDSDTPYAVVFGTPQTTDAEYALVAANNFAVVNIDNDEAGFIYYTDALVDTITRARPDGSQRETLIDLRNAFGVSLPQFAPAGIVVDEVNGKLYWSDTYTGNISRANLDGSGVETVIDTASGWIRGLALDTTAGKMYWIDATSKMVHRANLNGTSIENLITDTVPYSIALDLTAGKLYWTDLTAGVGSVRRANLDGSSIEILWAGGPSATSLALDLTAGKMYWADPNQFLIHRANLDGTNDEVIVNAADFTAKSQIRGLTLDVEAGRLYWTDFVTKTVYRSNLDGSTIVPIATSDSLYGIAHVRFAPGVSVTTETGLSTTEGGSDDTFRVVLTTKPTANVTVPLSSSDATEGTASVSSLIFTPLNWYIPQTVTIATVEDTVVDGNISYSIVLGVTSSADAAYNGVNPADAAVVNFDNDSVKFFVADDASTDRTYRYGAAVNSLSNSTLNSGNAAPRGAASTSAGDKVWVVDANKKVYVYSATGTLLGSWTANSLASNATVEGITVNGNNVWLVDAKQDRVYYYANAATRLSGSQSATSNFLLHVNNISPKDLVTDGTNIWVVDDQVLDKVYKYTVSGTYVGAWAIDAVNGSPTGITLDPANPRHLWIVDNGTDRVYQYNDAVLKTSGTQLANLTFALPAGNTNPQGIADPPPASAGSPARVAVTEKYGSSYLAFSHNTSPIGHRTNYWWTSDADGATPNFNDDDGFQKLPRVGAWLDSAFDS